MRPPIATLALLGLLTALGSAFVTGCIGTHDEAWRPASRDEAPNQPAPPEPRAQPLPPAAGGSDASGADPTGSAHPESTGSARPIPPSEPTSEPEPGDSTFPAGTGGTSESPHETSDVTPSSPAGPWCGPVRCRPGEVCYRVQCVPACRSDADCGDSAECRQGICEVPACSANRDCGYGERCDPDEEKCTPVGVSECIADEDCGNDFFCATDGVCSVCGDTIGCPDGLVCLQRECIAERSPPVTFQRRAVSGLDVIQGWRENDGMGFGAGIGVVDVEGNGRPDLFVGAYGDRDDPACIYLNRSTPEEMRFDAAADCAGVEPTAWAAWAVDLDGDGRDELIVVGDSFVHVHAFHPSPERVELVHPRLDRHRLARCVPGAVAAMDITFDGQAELLIGCQAHTDEIERMEEHDWSNLLFRMNDQRAWIAIDATDDDPLLSDGVTLALGVADLNDNGLLDLVLVTDSFSSIGRRRVHFEPGAVLLRCAPDEDCTWRPVPFGVNTTNWGSYMGAGLVRVNGRDRLYLSDWGPNRLVHHVDSVPVDEARQRLADLGRRGGRLLFAWGVVVDDFTRNGLDDLIVTHGMTADLDVAVWEVHVDTLLTQEPDGTFSAWAEEAGFVPPADEPTDVAFLPAASRNAVKVDLTGDGLLEIVIASLNGPVKIYTEQPQGAPPPPRCTIAPRPRLVPAHGFGMAIAAGDTRDFRTRDIQGQMRAGAPTTVTSITQQGTLRFPSGFESRFDCLGEPGPVVIEEPDWIALESADFSTILTLSPLPTDEPIQVDAILRSSDGTMTRVSGEDLGEGRWRLAGTAQDVFPAINGRWVGRWFPVGP